MSAASKTYTFWQPLICQSIRFIIQDGGRHFLNDDFCWNIELFGCLRIGGRLALCLAFRSAMPHTPSTESNVVALTSSVYIHPTSVSRPVSSSVSSLLLTPTTASSPSTAAVICTYIHTMLPTVHMICSFLHST